MNGARYQCPARVHTWQRVDASERGVRAICTRCGKIKQGPVPADAAGGSLLPHAELVKLSREGDRTERDKRLVSELERKISNVPPWRKGETHEQRVQRMVWHRRNIMGYYLRHQKTFDRLGVHPRDYFESDENKDARDA